MLNTKKVVSREGVSNFVQSMLQSAEEKKEIKPQNRYDDVNPNDIERIMENLKKGKIRQ